MSMLKETSTDTAESPLVTTNAEEQPASARNVLAPDGLPWPQGYFDRIPPKQTLENAISMFGVRPSFYADGWPSYTFEEMNRPDYKGILPDEPMEVQELWNKWAEEPHQDLAR